MYFQVGAGDRRSVVTVVVMPGTFTDSVQSHDVKVAGSGDVKGDGYYDLLIYSPLANTAYIVYGMSVTGEAGGLAGLGLGELTSETGIKFFDGSIDKTFGFSVSGA